MDVSQLIWSFTSLEPHDHEDVILEMMQAFEEPFYGIQISIPDGSYYEADDGVSWGVNPTYQHDCELQRR